MSDSFENILRAFGKEIDTLKAQVKKLEESKTTVEARLTKHNM